MDCEWPDLDISFFLNNLGFYFDEFTPDYKQTAVVEAINALIKLREGN